MEVYERIRELRKKKLHLSQTEFGNRLGVSRSVIKNIELNALSRPDQKLSLIKLICKEFSVNEDWILNGNEPMFVAQDTFSLEQFIREHGASDLEKEIMKAYFELDPEIRKTVLNHFKDRLSSAAPAAEPATSEPSIEEGETEYKKSVLNSASSTGYTASSTTKDTRENAIEDGKASAL